MLNCLVWDVLLQRSSQKCAQNILRCFILETILLRFDELEEVGGGKVDFIASYLSHPIIQGLGSALTDVLVCHRYGSFSAMYSHRRAMAVFIVHHSLIQHCAEVYAIAWTEWGALSLICTHFSLVGMWGRILDHTNLKLHWVSQLHGWAGPDLFYDVYRIQESLADKPTWWGISESRKSDYSKIIRGTLHLVVL